MTVRTLHHWDEIGLADRRCAAAGYRLYTAGDLERLHRIVIYREIGLGLDRIRAVLDDSEQQTCPAHCARGCRLLNGSTASSELSAGLDRMIDAHERGLLLTIEAAGRDLRPQWNPGGFRPGARRLYGDTTQ
ncbi:MerR family transcriptional regulator [Streptomyces lydicus]|nr:MerR family transcriptional regulator [Streptomyces lydicus]